MAAIRTNGDAPTNREAPTGDRLVVVPNHREDIERNAGRARTIAQAIEAGRKRLDRQSLGERDRPDRIQMRTARLHPDDTVGLERIVGDRDILQITYLHEALRAARSVCRIRIRGESARVEDL